MPVCQFQHIPKALKLYAIEIMTSTDNLRYNAAFFEPAFNGEK
jgi:hypothetical protein